MVEDRFWCLECEAFVPERHRCEQWSQTKRIPKEAIEQLMDMKEQKMEVVSRSEFKTVQRKSAQKRTELANDIAALTDKLNKMANHSHPISVDPHVIGPPTDEFPAHVLHGGGQWECGKHGVIENSDIGRDHEGHFHVVHSGTFIDEVCRSVTYIPDDKEQSPPAYSFKSEHCFGHESEVPSRIKVIEGYYCDKCSLIISDAEKEWRQVPDFTGGHYIHKDCGSTIEYIFLHAIHRLMNQLNRMPYDELRKCEVAWDKMLSNKKGGYDEGEA